MSKTLFSLDWSVRYWKLDPCTNCGANFWEKDWVFHKQSKGRDRYSCFTCGADVYPGGPVNQTLADAVASGALS